MGRSPYCSRAGRPLRWAAMKRIRSTAYYLGAAGVGAAAQFEMGGDVPLILWVVAVTLLLAGIFTREETQT